jgi:glycosyltransferase involved in cell wall biosynthesis
MKRILIVLPNLDLGGMETVVMNYFRNIDRSRLVFDFVVHGEKGFFEEEAIALGAKIFRVPTRSQNFFANIFAMRKIYKGVAKISDDAYFAERFIAGGRENISPEKYETVIVCTEHAFAFIELFVAWISGVKTRAAWSHFSDYQGKSKLKRRLHFLARPLMRLFCNLYLACTQDAGRWLFGNAFAKMKTAHIVNNAVDLNAFKFCPQTRARVRKAYGLGENDYIAGMAGRLTPVKNHAFALDVISACEGAKLLIVGDGVLRAEIEGIIERLGITHRVTLAGWQENTADFYHAMDVLLLPSFHEGLSLVTLEAQAAGLGVLASDTITRECKITANVHFLPLQAGANAWAEKINEMKSGTVNRTVDLTDSGFHIAREAEKFKNIFIKV